MFYPRKGKLFGYRKNKGMRRENTPTSNVKVCSDEEDLKGFLKNKAVLCVSWGEEDTSFLAPNNTFKFNKPITGLDVSSGGLGVAVGGEAVLVFDTQNGSVRREFKDHVAEVYSGRLFPSGIVGLSGGCDMQLKVWSCADGKCPVTFKGHTKAVTGTQIIGRGRNVVSVSRDGTAKVWNCAQASCTGTVDLDEVLNCCRLTNSAGADNQDDAALDRVDGKVLLVGGEQGGLFSLDLANTSIIKRYACETAVNSVTSTKQTAVAGCQNGELLLFPSDDLSEPLTRIHTSNSPVHCICPLDEGFIVGRKDGTATVHFVNTNTNIQLTGPDNDAVDGISSDQEYVYTASRDGSVRKYSRANINLAKQG